jgi:hypothetical protein
MRAALCAAFLVSNIVIFYSLGRKKRYAQYCDGQAPSYLCGIPMWCDSFDTLNTERVRASDDAPVGEWMRD